PGREPPQVDEEQPHARYRRFLAPHAAYVFVAQYVAPLREAAPARFPADQPPHGFGQRAAQAPVPLAVDAAQSLPGPGALLAGTTAYVAPGLFAVVEALPVHDFHN